MSQQSSSPVASEPQSSPKPKFERLPSTVIPLSYELNLRPDLVNFTFSGLVKIMVDIRAKVDQIILNSAELKICEEKSFIRSVDGKIVWLKIEYDPTNETATFKAQDQGQELPQGQAMLVVRFHGTLNDKMKGFYRSKYTGPDGQIRWTAVTQFEPTNARYAFPCFDEPALKASFDISLTVSNDNKIKALSNMSQIKETIIEDNLRLVTFARTPVMSTYLVAFVVGEFDSIETRSEDNVQVRVFTPISKSSLGKFAMEMAVSALAYYKKYFEIAYPLDKMDLVAVSDFASGAMENWGLVTYREDCILVDPANSSTRTKQNVALVVAHELAHQWFGNLVTMEWWTHLWLNEGFASFIENLCVDAIYPEYNIWTQFVADVFLTAMDLDGLDNSHPIEVPVGHPSEVDEIFDDISYSKGASVIRMLHKYIGDDAFRKGMNLYLTKHSYRNTQTEDLWDSLEEASKKPVRRVMSTWTKQKGYPVILVSATFDKSDCCVIELSQEKFSLNGKLSDEDRKALWAVPISIITSSSNNKPVYEGLLDSATLTITLNRDQLSPSEWFKLNPSTSTTCRVRYSPELMCKFFKSISDKSLSPLDRLGLSSDLFALSLSGQQSFVHLLRFLGSFREETDYTVWVSLIGILYRLDQLFAHTDFWERYARFVRDLLNHSAFASIGWTPKPDEPYLDTLLRSKMLSCLINFDDERVLAECRRLFSEYLNEPTKPIQADIRLAVYQGVCSYANEDTFEQLLKLYRQSDLQEERYRISCSLGWAQNVELLRRVLDFAISPEVVSSDSGYVIGSVSSNYAGRQMAWDFFVNNRQLFLDRYRGTGGCLIANLATSLTENFHTEHRAKEVLEFFTQNHFPGTERTIQQAVETIRINGSILRREVDLVRNYLQSL